MTISIEFISALIGLFLTLMIFSYLLGDNPLFRFAIYLFIGVASGYAAAVTIHSVFLPRLSLFQAGNLDQLLLDVIIPLVISATILAKFLPRIAWIGNFAMAILVGVGAAAAIGGAVIGTLLPQVQASMDAFSASTGGNPNFVVRLFEGTVMLLGTIFTLASFHYGARRSPDGTVKRNRILEIIASFGRIFVATTLGVLFAGLYMAALTAMIERLTSIINFIRQLIGL